MSAGTQTLSESASKALLAGYGVPVVDERVVQTSTEAVEAADHLGYPVVCKLGGDAIAHKTERGLVRLDLADADAVARAAADLLAAARPEDGAVHVLVAPMLDAKRERIAGLATDPQFGMTVLVGVGGILAEAVADVAVRMVPIDRIDALDMIDQLQTQPILGPFRSEPPVDRDALADVLLALSAAAQDQPTLVSADCNPLLIVDGNPIAVDALVEQQA
jgi:acetyl-CoA synthetase (ADP-forming)